MERFRYMYMYVECTMYMYMCNMIVWRIKKYMQTSVLDEAASAHPNWWWWIKAGGCDLIKGLTEYVSGEWSGDVNIHPDALEKLFKEYKEILRFLNRLGLQDRANSVIFQNDIITVKEQIVGDIKFITTGVSLVSTFWWCIVQITSNLTLIRECVIYM